MRRFQLQGNPAFPRQRVLQKLHSGTCMSVSTEYIETSVFDLFKSGPGPSSSHTIGPMKAAHDFLLLCREQLDDLPASESAGESRLAFRVRLFGSLSAKGTAQTPPFWPACWGTSLRAALRDFSRISKRIRLVNTLSWQVRGRSGHLFPASRMTASCTIFLTAIH